MIKNLLKKIKVEKDAGFARSAVGELRHENRDEMRNENSSPQRGEILSEEIIFQISKILFSHSIFDFWVIFIDSFMKTEFLEIRMLFRNYRPHCAVKIPKTPGFCQDP